MVDLSRPLTFDTGPAPAGTPTPMPTPTTPATLAQAGDALPTFNVGTPAEQASEQRKKKLYDLAMAVRANAFDQGTGWSTADIGANAFLANLAKPINAAMDVAVGKAQQGLGTSPVPGATAGELWSASTNAFDDQMRAAQRQAGGYGTAANIAGSLASPVNWIAPESLVARTILGGGIGAAQGAAERSNSWADAASGALTGGLAGSATVGVLGAPAELGTGLLEGGAGAAREAIGKYADQSLWPSIWGGLSAAYAGVPLHIAAAGPATVAVAKGARKLVDRFNAPSDMIARLDAAGRAAPAAVDAAQSSFRDWLARTISQGTGTFASNVANSGGRSPY